jgi:hypothetical protein
LLRGASLSGASGQAGASLGGTLLLTDALMRGHAALAGRRAAVNIINIPAGIFVYKDHKSLVVCGVWWCP